MVGALRRIPLFEGLTDDELRWMVEQGSEKFVPAGEINQVWTNLIDNAITAIGGEAGQGLIGLRTTCEGDGVLVEVSDSGPGIPEELQARVFEPFYTTKGVGAETGLGLDIAYRIVVGRHGGDIRVVSKPGDTRFQVRLPLQPGGGIVDPERSVEAEEETPVR